MTDAETIVQLQDVITKQQAIIRRMYVERFPDTWFVCGEAGAKDSNNLPERIMVCPAYGCDWSQIYTRTSIAMGPEW